MVAMMSPVLIAPIRHICLRSFTHRRARSIVVFVAGYGAIWMALGAALLAIELVVKLWAPQPYLLVSSVVLIALVWQFSPIKRRCLQSMPRSSRTSRFISSSLIISSDNT